MSKTRGTFWEGNAVWGCVRLETLCVGKKHNVGGLRAADLLERDGTAGEEEEDSPVVTSTHH